MGRITTSHKPILPMDWRVTVRRFLILIATISLGVALSAQSYAAFAQPDQSGPNNLYGLPREQTLVLLGGESNNPRAYDPATGSRGTLIFSGLVSFNPQMQLTP